MRLLRRSIVVAVFLTLLIASQALAFSNVYWPSGLATHFGQIYGNFVASGVHTVLDQDLQTGDLYLYTIRSDGSLGTITFTDGSLWPAFYYGYRVGNDPVSGVGIFDFYASGTGLSGTFGFFGTYSLAGY